MLIKIQKLAVISFLFFLSCANNLLAKEAVLADFERDIPCSDNGDIVGFRKSDRMRATTIKDGAEGTEWSAEFKMLPSEKDIFFQGKVRRLYLATKNTKYDENGPNALSFWIKIKPDSSLISKNKKNTLGIWTYHWKFGDTNVGGKSNKTLATDSMMHGYCNFKFNEKAASRWVRVILTPSAFQQSRYYYHFYAAQGATDELKFFPSLRQIQFHFFPEIENEEQILIDQLKLVYHQPTAIFERDFYQAQVSKNAGDIVVPVSIKNPTDKNRKYRVFISSFLGVHRNALYVAHTLTDSFEPPRMMQAAAGGEGGIGVAELTDEKGDYVIDRGEELFIAAKSVWKGRLLYHIKPGMLGTVQQIRLDKYIFYAKRDTLTTSVIVWDPYDETASTMDYIEALPSNADDAAHEPPPDFPKQKKPPEGWRSNDIPLNQVGGYFVSVMQLTD